MTGKSQKFRDSRMTDEGKDICRRSFWFSVPIPGDFAQANSYDTKGAQTQDFNHKHVISYNCLLVMTETTDGREDVKVADTSRVPIVTPRRAPLVQHQG